MENEEGRHPLTSLASVSYTISMAFLTPDHAIAPLHLAEGMKVADFGTGSGAMALAAARRVGHSGKVYAIDIQKGLLEKLAQSAASHHVSNLEVVWGNIDHSHGSKLANASVDAVLIANVLFQSEHVGNLTSEAKRILKPHGKALVIDWTDSFGNMGPAHGHVVKESEAKLFFADAGFVFEKSEPAGDHHYSLLFHKP